MWQRRCGGAVPCWPSRSAARAAPLPRAGHLPAICLTGGPAVDHRTVYSARKALGGGVTIDLIHEWDYLVELFGVPEKLYTFKGTYLS